MRKIKTDNIIFYKVNPHDKNDLSDLLGIMETMRISFLKTLYSDEILNYIGYFLSEEAIKNKIIFDNHVFYLLKDKQLTAGFFDFKKADNVILISDIYLIDDKRNQGIGKLVFDFIKHKAKELNVRKIIAYIGQNNKTAKEIFKKQGFKITDTQAKYLGSDIFLFVNVFELSCNYIEQKQSRYSHDTL